MHGSRGCCITEALVQPSHPTTYASDLVGACSGTSAHDGRIKWRWSIFHVVSSPFDSINGRHGCISRSTPCGAPMTYSRIRCMMSKAIFRPMASMQEHESWICDRMPSVTA